MTKSSFFKQYSAAAALAITIAGAVILSGCGTSAATDANTNTAADKSVAITTAQAELRPVGRYLQATGSLMADDTSQVASQVSGRVLSTPVDVGAFVTAGSVIIQLNTRDAELRLQQARAGEAQALAALNQAKARIGLSGGEKFDPLSVPEVLAAYQNVQAAESQITNAEAQLANTEAQYRLAQDTARRYANLARTGDASQLLYLQHKTQAEQALTQVNAARANVNTLRAQTIAARRQYDVAINTAKQNNQGIESAEANYANARTQTAIAQKAVADSTITAPFSGFISERFVAAGEYVTPATPLVTLVRTNPIKINLLIPEPETSKVRVGLPVSISVSAYPERNFAGRVSAISPSNDPESRSVRVEAEIDNGQNLLRANMFATGKILQEGGENAVFVPKTAVVEDPNMNSRRVFVVRDGVARLVIVQTGEEEADMVRVTSGLDGTETVATSGLNELFDGVPVRAGE